METIVSIALVIFVPVCVVLTLIILLQDSKGEGLSSSAFGGAEMQSMLGGHGAATFLSKLTTWVAVGFMVISLFLMRFYGESSDNTLEPIKAEQTQQQTEQPVDTENSQADSENTPEDNPKGTLEPVPQEENGAEGGQGASEDNPKGTTPAPKEETE